MSERCGYSVTNKDGEQEPCDRPATGWRWYQNVSEHEDMLDVACDYHRNEGGQRIHDAEAALTEARAEVERLSDALSASEGERDDLDTAVGTLLGENVELVAELATTRETLRRVEEVLPKHERAVVAARLAGEVEYPVAVGALCEQIRAALAHSAQEGQG